MQGETVKKKHNKGIECQKGNLCLEKVGSKWWDGGRKGCSFK